MSSPESGDDRGSRAMAIAVSRSSFILYAFKPRKQIESEVEGDKKVLGDKFDPIKEVSWESKRDVKLYPI